MSTYDELRQAAWRSVAGQGGPNHLKRDPSAGARSHADTGDVGFSLPYVEIRSRPG